MRGMKGTRGMKVMKDMRVRMRVQVVRGYVRGQRYETYEGHKK